MVSLLNDCRALWQARALVWVLTRREIAARHTGTAAGVLWPYLQPLLTVAAYYLVFDVVFSMRLGEGAPTHAVGTFLIVGALPWMAFCDAVSRGMNSLIEAGGLLQKNPLPPVLFTARAVLAAALRDTVQMVGFLLSVGIYLSPILFPLTLFPENWRWVLWLNPMTALVQGYQHVLLQGAWPPMSVWLVTSGWLVGVAALLNVAVKRSRDQLVDWL